MTGSLLFLALTSFVGLAVAQPLLEVPPRNVAEINYAVDNTAYGTVTSNVMGYSYYYDQADYILMSYDFGISQYRALYDDFNGHFVDMYYQNNLMYMNEYENLADYLGDDAWEVNGTSCPLHILFDFTYGDDIVYFIPYYRTRSVDLGDKQFYCNTLEFSLNSLSGDDNFGGFEAQTFEFNDTSYNYFATFNFDTYYGYYTNFPFGNSNTTDNLFGNVYRFRYYTNDLDIYDLDVFDIHFRLVGSLESSTDYYARGYQDGYNFGQKEGYDNGYHDGDLDGYARGLHDGLSSAQQGSFSSLFGAIADTPIIMLRSLFNFDLFGMNMFIIIMSLLTGIIVIYVVKKVVK